MLQKTNLEFRYDDFEVIADSLFHGFSENKECLLSSSLKELIPLDTSEIYLSGQLRYLKNGAGYWLFGSDGQLIDRPLSEVQSNSGWLALQRDDGWMLLSRKSDLATPLNQLDSIRLITDEAAFLKKGDTLQVQFQNGRTEWLQPNETIRVLSDPSNPLGIFQYLVFGSKNYQKVFHADGSFLFESRYEELNFLSDSLFVYKKRGKAGVITISGKELTDALYEVVNVQDGLIFLLRGGQIGCLDVTTGALLPTSYETRITRFGPHYLVSADGKVGVVNASNKLILPVQYDRLLQWNDTSAWAKTGELWQLVSFDKTVLMDQVLSVVPWLTKGHEQLMMILTSQGHGLFSNLRGELLETGYNDIQNLGTEAEPMIFAEQHLRRAGYYVITYFDWLGGALRSQAYRPAEYLRIYCEE